MNFNEEYQKLDDALCKRLRWIKNKKNVLPHTVFIEEEVTDSQNVSSVAYVEYTLTSISKDGSCKVLDKETGKIEKRGLKEIEPHWLRIIWEYFIDTELSKGNRHPEELYLEESGEWQQEALIALEAEDIGTQEDKNFFVNEKWNPADNLLHNLARYISETNLLEGKHLPVMSRIRIIYHENENLRLFGEPAGYFLGEDSQGLIHILLDDKRYLKLQPDEEFDWITIPQGQLYVLKKDLPGDEGEVMRAGTVCESSTTFNGWNLWLNPIGYDSNSVAVVIGDCSYEELALDDPRRDQLEEIRQLQSVQETKYWKDLRSGIIERSYEVK